MAAQAAGALDSEPARPGFARPDPVLPPLRRCDRPAAREQVGGDRARAAACGDGRAAEAHRDDRAFAPELHAGEPRADAAVVRRWRRVGGEVPHLDDGIPARLRGPGEPGAVERPAVRVALTLDLAVVDLEGDGFDVPAVRAGGEPARGQRDVVEALGLARDRARLGGARREHVDTRPVRPGERPVGVECDSVDDAREGDVAQPVDGLAGPPVGDDQRLLVRTGGRVPAGRREDALRHAPRLAGGQVDHARVARAPAADAEHVAAEPEGEVVDVGALAARGEAEAPVERGRRAGGEVHAHEVMRGGAPAIGVGADLALEERRGPRGGDRVRARPTLHGRERGDVARNAVLPGRDERRAGPALLDPDHLSGGEGDGGAGERGRRAWCGDGVRGGVRGGRGSSEDEQSEEGAHAVVIPGSARCKRSGTLGG